MTYIYSFTKTSIQPNAINDYPLIIRPYVISKSRYKYIDLLLSLSRVVSFMCVNLKLLFMSLIRYDKIVLYYHRKQQ